MPRKNELTIEQIMIQDVYDAVLIGITKTKFKNSTKPTDEFDLANRWNGYSHMNYRAEMANVLKKQLSKQKEVAQLRPNKNKSEDC